MASRRSTHSLGSLGLLQSLLHTRCASSCSMSVMSSSSLEAVRTLSTCVQGQCGIGGFGQGTGAVPQPPFDNQAARALLLGPEGSPEQATRRLQQFVTLWAAVRPRASDHMLGHRLWYGGRGWRLFARAVVCVHLQQPTPAASMPLWGGVLPWHSINVWAC